MRKLMTIVTLIFAMLAAPSAAESTGSSVEELQKRIDGQNTAICNKTPHAAATLACIARGGVYTGEVDPDYPQWEINDYRDIIDDERRVVLSIKEVFLGDFKLIIRCERNITDMYIRFGRNYMSGHDDRHKTVAFRLDREKSSKKKFDNSIDKTAMFYPGSPITFIKKMMNHDWLYVRAVPYNENYVDGSFPITGLEDAIKPLREACNW